ncbi:hypothetical protein IAR55_004590 [Kwoniella newhampshirensis]|uniref:Uncharacterized protein n=1 Tax=Kwoniella newhampshirensis TaxID=1651941 RepID=A0AAW0Z0W1_9TREE
MHFALAFTILSLLVAQGVNSLPRPQTETSPAIAPDVQSSEVGLPTVTSSPASISNDDPSADFSSDQHAAGPDSDDPRPDAGESSSDSDPVIPSLSSDPGHHDTIYPTSPDTKDELAPGHGQPMIPVELDGNSPSPGGGSGPNFGPGRNITDPFPNIPFEGYNGTSSRPHHGHLHVHHGSSFNFTGGFGGRPGTENSPAFEYGNGNTTGGFHGQGGPFNFTDLAAAPEGAEGPKDHVGTDDGAGASTGPGGIGCTTGGPGAEGASGGSGNGTFAFGGGEGGGSGPGSSEGEGSGLGGAGDRAGEGEGGDGPGFGGAPEGEREDPAPGREGEGSAGGHGGKFGAAAGGDDGDEGGEDNDGSQSNADGGDDGDDVDDVDGGDAGAEDGSDDGDDIGEDDGDDGGDDGDGDDGDGEGGDGEGGNGDDGDGDDGNPPEDADDSHEADDNGGGPTTATKDDGQDFPGGQGGVVPGGAAPSTPGPNMDEGDEGPISTGQNSGQGLASSDDALGSGSNPPRSGEDTDVDARGTGFDG